MPASAAARVQTAQPPALPAVKAPGLPKKGTLYRGKSADGQVRANLVLFRAIVVPREGSGEAQEEHVRAVSKEIAIETLERRGLRVKSIKPIMAKDPVTQHANVTPMELANFSKQLSKMLDAGMGIDDALDVILADTECQPFRQAIPVIQQDIARGSGISASFGRHPGIFDTVTLALIQAGEESGTLPAMLTMLAEKAEKSGKLRNKIREAAMYPIALIIIGSICMGILYTRVLPQFAKLYSDMGCELPLLTAMSMKVSNFLVKNFFILIGVAGLAFIAARKFFRTEQGKDFLETMVCRVRPLKLFRTIWEKSSIALFSRTMATLLGAGEIISIFRTLELSSASATMPRHRKALADMKESIHRGKDLVESIDENYAFRRLFKSYVVVGQNTGGVDDMLRYLAGQYEEEVASDLAKMSSVIEPAILLVLGVLIGLSAISMYLPMFDLINKIN